jgi:hypothetical protein
MKRQRGSKSSETRQVDAAFRLWPTDWQGEEHPTAGGQRGSGSSGAGEELDAAAARPTVGNSGTVEAGERMREGE